MSTAWESRPSALRRDTESRSLDSARMHGWTATTDREVEEGEYGVVKAYRAGLYAERAVEAAT